MTELSNIIGDYQTFLKTILNKVEAAGFDLNDFSQLDHMCYRAVSEENYEQKKLELSTVGKLLAENMVNNRPIAVFRLHEPVLYDKWRIDAIELPAPKPDKQFAEGLDHIELVLLDDKDAFLAKYAGKEFDLKAAERGINPEIAYHLDDKLTVKFHLLSLPAVIYLEKKLGIGDVK